MKEVKKTENEIEEAKKAIMKRRRRIKNPKWMIILMRVIKEDELVIDKLKNRS